MAYSESSNEEVSFSISNVGTVQANSVSVIIPKQSGWLIQGTNSVIIGNLNKGDYTVAGFNLKPKTTNDNENLNFEIVYTDTTGKRQTIKKTVNMQIGENFGLSKSDVNKRAGQNASTQTSYVKYGVIILILVGGFFYYRKKKNQN